MDKFKFENNFKTWFFKYNNPHHLKIDTEMDIHTAKPIPTHYVCNKCKSNLIWINVKQTRSGDEGQTTFCECSECGHKWSSN